jgi:tetratricopeptide (TPR) repeat protein
MKKYLIPLILFLFLSVWTGCAIHRNTLIPERKMIDTEMDPRAKKYYLQGVMDEFAMDYENALLHYYMAKSFDPDNIAITVAIAELQIQLGQYDVALLFLDDGLKVFPEEQRLLQKKAEVLTKLKRLHEAYTLYKKLLQRYPFNYYYQIITRNLAQVLQDPQEEEWVYRFIADKNKNSDSYVQLGRFYYKQKKYFSALESFIKATELDSSNAEALAGQVDCYITTGKYDQSIPLLKKIYQLTGDSYFINRILELFYKQEKYDQLVQFLEKFLAENRGEPHFYLILADALYNKKDLNRALEMLHKYADSVQNQKDNSYYNIMARIYLDQKKDSLALNILDEGIRLYPKSLQLVLLKGFTLANLKQYQEAVTFLQKHEPKFAHSVPLLTLHAQILFEQNKREEMLPIVNQILKKDSTNHFALSFLTSYYMDKGENQKCDSLFSLAISFYPDDPLLLNNYAYFLSLQGKRLEEALQMVKKALQKDPKNPAYLDTRGWIYYQLGKYEEALHNILEASRYGQNDPDILEHLGDVYWKLNQPEKAREFWQKALQAKPDKQSIKQKLESGL